MSAKYKHNGHEVSALKRLLTSACRPCRDNGSMHFLPCAVQQRQLSASAVMLHNIWQMHFVKHDTVALSATIVAWQQAIIVYNYSHSMLDILNTQKQNMLIIAWRYEIHDDWSNLAETMA